MIGIGKKEQLQFGEIILTPRPNYIKVIGLPVWQGITINGSLATYIAFLTIYLN